MAIAILKNRLLELERLPKNQKQNPLIVLFNGQSKADYLLEHPEITLNPAMPELIVRIMNV